MRSDIRKAVEALVKEGGNINEIKRKIEEKFPGIGVKIEKTTIDISDVDAQSNDESEESQDNKDCDCLTCLINKALKDSEYWKLENVSKRQKYQIMDKGLKNNTGDCIGNWIDVREGNKAHLKDSLKELESAIKEVEMCKLAELSIDENIKRLMKEGAKL